MTFREVLGTLVFNVFVTRAFSGNVQAVWMAPRVTPPGSALAVNASTSVGALAYAVDSIYRNGILANGIFQYVQCCRIVHVQCIIIKKVGEKSHTYFFKMILL